MPVKNPRKRNYYSPRNQHPEFDIKPLRSVNSLAGRFQVKSDGSLEISDVTASDEGKFECRITNGIGKPISASAYLAVECMWNSCSHYDYLERYQYTLYL